MSHVAGGCILWIMGTLTGTFIGVRKVDDSEGDGGILNGRSAYLLCKTLSQIVPESSGVLLRRFYTVLSLAIVACYLH